MVANGVIEGNLIITGFQCRHPIVNGFGGMVYRNNLVSISGDKDARPIGGFARGIVAMVRLGGGAPGQRANEDAYVGVYNNTFVNLSTTAAPEYVDEIGFSDVEFANNLLYEPNLAVPNTPHAPLLETASVAPRYKGYRARNGKLHKAHMTLPSGGSLWVPAIGSTALGAAFAGTDACTDFRGNLRPEPSSIGAFEVD